MFSQVLKSIFGPSIILYSLCAQAQTQFTVANNGLSGSGNTVSLGGTLLNAQTSLDFGNSNFSSSFLIKKGTGNYFSIGNDGAVKIYKGLIMGDPGSAAPNEHIINYFGNFQYDSKGLKLVDNTSGSIVRLHSFNNALYLTTDNGQPAGLTLGSRFNPWDNSEFRAGYQRWEIRAGSFTVNQDWLGDGQFEMTVGNAARKGILVKAAASQTANLQEWQNNSGTALSVVTSGGNMGIGMSSPTFKLNVNGDAEIGDTHDPTAYGMLQIGRPSNQSDNKHHLSFIRNGVSVAGMGYAPNSSVLGIWHANNNSGAPLIGMTYDQKVGIGVLNPAFKLDMDSPDNDAGNGDTRFRIANTSSSGNNAAGSRPTIEILGARGDGNTSFEGKLALGTRRTDGNALNNQTLGAILFGGQHGTDQTFQATKILYPASIQGYAEGTFTNATSMPTGIAFFTSSNGDAAGASNLSYGTERMRIGSNGSVGIGTTKIADDGYKLFVELGIRTRKVKVDQTNWSDYVFEKDYPLPTLNEVEHFISINKHLPGVPSAKEVENNGLDLGDAQAMLLKKIEELTLYLLEQNKTSELQEKRIAELETEIKAIKRK